MRLKNKVAIVTGANGGMGINMVERFIKEGATVVPVDIDTDRVLELLKDYPGAHKAHQCDLSNEPSVNKLIENITNQYGQIDIVVNLAGIAQAATPIEQVSEDYWQKIMDVNAKSVFLMSKSVAPIMKDAKQGVIINISSIAAERPRPGLNVYIASKGAVIALTKALAIELAENNIRVNAINPGPSDTKMLGEFAAKVADRDNVRKEVFADSVPLGRLIHPNDISGGVVYLCSDEAEMVTGSVFNIDGGRGL